MNRVPVAVSMDRNALMHAAAERVVHSAAEAIAAHGRFDWALSGGSTPQRLYSLLASSEYNRRIDWVRVHFFWGDERCVPPTHAESNYRMARESLLSTLDIPASNVHRLRGELEPATAAGEYESELRRHFELASAKALAERAQPTFDLVLLGMGADGHTASLFPGTAALSEKERWVVPNRVDKLSSWRLTLTFSVINAARYVVLLVAGADKAERLKQVLTHEPTATPLPAGLVAPAHGELQWLTDREAASLLPAATLEAGFPAAAQGPR